MVDTLITSVVNIPSAEIASKTFVAATYLTQANAISTYLSKTDAAATYVKQAYGFSSTTDREDEISVEYSSTRYKLVSGDISGNGFVDVDGVMTCTIAGGYKFDWNISASYVDVQRLNGGLLVNDDPVGFGYGEVTAFKDNIFNISGTGIVKLSVGDVVALGIFDKDTTGTAIIRQTNLTLMQVKP